MVRVLTYHILNLERFPADFMFQLNLIEFEMIRRQIGTLNRSSSQTVMMKNLPLNRKGKYLPYAFTEQGVAMLSGVLRSSKAIHINIAIMQAFVEVRKVLLNQTDLKQQLKEIKKHLGEHDAQLNQIYDAMENLLDEKAAQTKWEEWERIGFRNRGNRLCDSTMP